MCAYISIQRINLYDLHSKVMNGVSLCLDCGSPLKTSFLQNKGLMYFFSTIAFRGTWQYYYIKSAARVNLMACTSHSKSKQPVWLCMSLLNCSPSTQMKEVTYMQVIWTLKHFVITWMEVHGVQLLYRPKIHLAKKKWKLMSCLITLGNTVKFCRDLCRLTIEWQKLDKGCHIG